MHVEEAGYRCYEPTSHKSVDYRAYKRGFQASRKQSQSLHLALIKQLHIPFLLNLISLVEEKPNNKFPIYLNIYYITQNIQVFLQ
jgi:hypothetical protein